MINLLHGNCLELMKTIPDGSIDAIITDPPYGTTACKWDSVIPFDLMWEQLNRIIKRTGAIVLFGSEPFSSALRMSNIKNYKYDWIWQKNRPSLFQHANKRPMKDHENIIVFYKKQATYNLELIEKEKPSNNYRKNKIGTFISDGLKNKNQMQTLTGYPRQIINYGMHNVGQVHPTQKPVLLMEYLIKTYTNENETVLDFTMGSGSTGVACVNTNRNFIGIEKDENYFKIATERINSKNLFTN
jgi:site-specific DNA-methyltransferase (adenine-specific)